MRETSITEKPIRQVNGYVISYRYRGYIIERSPTWLAVWYYLILNPSGKCIGRANTRKIAMQTIDRLEAFRNA